MDKYAAFKLRKELEDFNTRLVDFHRHKSINTPIISWPTLNGKSIDLFRLYVKVVDMGGWERVCEKEKWTDVCAHLDKSMLNACTNSSHALKLIYLRFLSAYEKVHMAPASIAVITQQQHQFSATTNANAVPSVGYLIENYLKTNSSGSLVPNGGGAGSSITNGFNGMSTSRSFGYGTSVLNSSGFHEDKEDEILSGKCIGFKDFF